ncbi:hypothetical protein CK203_059111 [Vitis vinifera]|uniref:Uncharacterized protein n=1 Tax=Vitis vinifera TaxID=29760 RepID=A0A438GCK0_VITVI|nr:hypothetical protein CK203_059111 [Vitis vinifera]
MGRGAARRPMGLSNTPGRPTGNTPFALAYGMDAVIPTEIGKAAIRMADYQQRASAHYNRKQTPVLAPLFVQPSAAANLPLFLFDRNFCPELPHLPLRPAISSAASSRRAPLIPPGPLRQPNLPGGPHSPPGGGYAGFGLHQSQAQMLKGLAEVQDASLTGFPPMRQEKMTLVPDSGPQHLAGWTSLGATSTFTAGWTSPGATSAGTTTGTAGVSVTISTSPPPDERRGQMSN